MRFGAFAALSLAILRGFVRDKMSVFFAIVFPLMRCSSPSSSR